MLKSVLPCLGRSFRVSRGLSSSATKDSYLINPGSEPLTHATIGETFQQTVEKYPGRVAVKSVFEDISLTYEELLIQADKLGCALRAQGLQKGDRVGIWSHNTTAYIVALIAVARAGLISEWAMWSWRTRPHNYLWKANGHSSQDRTIC